MRQPSQPDWRTDLTAAHLGLRQRDIIGIVLHDTAGAGTHNDTVYLASNNSREVSVDFTVERNSGIWKLNDQLAQKHCNHAGRNTAWRGLANHQVNEATIGIGIVQKDTLSLSPVYSRVQVRSVGQLCAWLVSRFGLQASDITTHRQIVTDGSRSDPRRFPFDGRDGFWFYYWEAFGQEERFLASLAGPVPEET